MHVRTGFHLMRNVVARSCVVRWDRAEARRREGNRRGSKVSAAQTQDTMSARRGGSSTAAWIRPRTTHLLLLYCLPFIVNILTRLARTWTNYLHIQSGKRLLMRPFQSMISNTEKDHRLSSD